MREIEIKARISNRKDIITKLKTLGLDLGEPVKQHDIVYGQYDTKNEMWRPIWLRIRTENNKKVIFTLKIPVSGQLDSIEHEVQVNDADKLETIINLLGFELYSDLTKRRLKGRLDTIEICIDQVPNLGNFIEAEMLTDDHADHEKVVNELWDLFARVGITRTDEVREGYDVLVRKKLGMAPN